MSNLFRDFYNKLRNNIKSRTDSEYEYGSFKTTKKIETLINKENLKKIFDYEIIETGFLKSMKGNWGLTGDPLKAGISQDLNRISYISAISHLRTVNTPMDRSTKIVEPHKLHSSQWGMICPAETPSGASVGLTKNLSLLCQISSDFSKEPIIKCLREQKIQFLDEINPSQVNDSCKIFINSNWIGITQEPKYIEKKLKLYRRNSILPYQLSISYDVLNQEIHLLTEAGRCLRPLFIVENNKLLITEDDIKKVKKGETNWFDLLRGSFLDNKDIITVSYTHLTLPTKRIV